MEIFSWLYKRLEVLWYNYPKESLSPNSTRLTKFEDIYYSFFHEFLISLLKFNFLSPAFYSAQTIKLNILCQSLLNH